MQIGFIRTITAALCHSASQVGAILRNPQATGELLGLKAKGTHRRPAGRAGGQPSPADGGGATARSSSGNARDASCLSSCPRPLEGRGDVRRTPAPGQCPAKGGLELSPAQEPPPRPLVPAGVRKTCQRLPQAPGTRGPLLVLGRTVCQAWADICPPGLEKMT